MQIDSLVVPNRLKSRPELVSGSALSESMLESRHINL